MRIEAVARTGLTQRRTARRLWRSSGSHVTLQKLKHDSVIFLNWENDHMSADRRILKLLQYFFKQGKKHTTFGTFGKNTKVTIAFFKEKEKEKQLQKITLLNIYFHDRKDDRSGSAPQHPFFHEPLPKDFNSGGHKLTLFAETTD